MVKKYENLVVSKLVGANHALSKSGSVDRPLILFDRQSEGLREKVNNTHYATQFWQWQCCVAIVWIPTTLCCLLTNSQGSNVTQELKPSPV